MGSYEHDEVVNDVLPDTALIFKKILEGAVEDLEAIDPKLMCRALALHDGLLLAHINFTLKCYQEEAQNRLIEPDIPAARKDGHTTKLHVAKPACRAIDSFAQSWVTDWEKDHPNYTQAERNQAVETINWVSASQFDSEFKEG